MDDYVRACLKYQKTALKKTRQADQLAKIIARVHDMADEEPVVANNSGRNRSARKRGDGASSQT